MTSLEIPTGQPGNLLPEQEEKLREFWAALLKLCGVHQDGDTASVAEPAAASQTDGALGDDGTKVKKKRLGIFSRKQPDAKKGDTAAAAADAKPAATTATSDQAVATDDPNDKYGQTKQFRDTLATMSPEQLHETLWTMVKHDHPDALCLRFLRARKWDVQKALVMLVATMNWRATQMHVDSDIMRSGEEGALADCQSEDAKVKKVAIDFMSQMRQGKTILHGVDKRGNPVCITRVRLHKIGEQSEEALERYTVYLIETTRMVLRPPVETATMVFDMTGFSMANMDYTPVKFIIKCFEANYPESLATVLVHNAPWIFQGIWRIIRGWLDPVVANKIIFSNNFKDLRELFPEGRVPEMLENAEDWQYHYVEPVPGENEKMKDAATRDKLQATRDALIEEYTRNTLEWIKTGSDQATVPALKKQREELAAKLTSSYWDLDPYIRARSLFDRIGVIQGEKVDHYAARSLTAIVKAPTAVDDVD